jgi:hypothetical protein
MHNQLMDALEFELDHYGASSLAEMIATLCEIRQEAAEERGEDPVLNALGEKNPMHYWKTAADRFHTTANELAGRRDRPTPRKVENG